MTAEIQIDDVCVKVRNDGNLSYVDMHTGASQVNMILTKKELTALVGIFDLAQDDLNDFR